MTQQALGPLNSSTLAGILDSLFPVQLRRVRGDNDNALEYRNLMLLGSQGSGKTTTIQGLALALGRKYGLDKTVFAIQVAGIDRLLAIPTRIACKCWLLCAEDVTLAKVPLTDLNRFFQVRHLIEQNTGLREGMAVTVFNTHTFHGLNKNLRDTFNALIIKSVPTNPYDRSILKRYFSPWLLDEFERTWAIDKALVWTPCHNHGIQVQVVPPGKGIIEETKVKRSFWSWLRASQP